MGLDVYLYRYEDRDASLSLEKQYSERADTIWGERDWNLASAEEKTDRDARLAGLKLELGLDEHGDDPRKKKIEINSAKHPDHLFKVGYFRSSYNEGGINVRLRECLNTDLAKIMGQDEEYDFRPNWQAARQRAAAALDELTRIKNAAKYAAVKIDCFNPFAREAPKVTNGQEALAVFLEEVKKRAEYAAKGQTGFDNYTSGSNIFFFGQQPKCLAFIGAVENVFKMPTPLVFGITETSGEETFGFYCQALEIVIETCDYVLNSGEQKKFWLHWSG